MRNTIIRTVFLSLLIATASCSYLDELPTSNLVEEQVYSSAASAQSALDGCYRALIGICSSQYFNDISAASILQHEQQTPQEAWFSHTLYSNHTSNARVYMNAYSAISKCNTFIDCATASDLPSEQVEQWVAHAHFLRAWYYFFATRLWGDLPLVTSKVVNSEQAEVERSKYTLIYKQILEDLEYAEKHLVARSALSDEEIKKGYVCNYSATALKAKVYVQIASLMTSAANGVDDQWFDLTKEGRYPDFSECGIPKDNVEKAWSLALECAEDVMQNGPFSLEPDYANLFRFSPDEHPEDYLSAERIITVPVTSALTGGTYVYASWSLPKRPWGSSETTEDNGNKLRIRPSRFTWETWCEKYGSDSDFVEKEDAQLGYYSYYKGCPDPRMDASYYSDIYYTISNTGAQSKNYCYPNASRVAYSASVDLSSYNTTQALNCAPIYKKGFSASYRGNGSGGDADIYLFRYADVILLAAEAAANLDQKDKAVEYVNKILERARNSTNNNASYQHVYGEAPAAAPADWKAAAYSTKEELIVAILWERVFEMDYEGQSLYDTRRYGANFYIENFVRPYNIFMHSAANYRIWMSPVGLFGRDREEDLSRVRAGLLIAYPEYEILNNPALDYTTGQNDFYIQ